MTEGANGDERRSVRRRVLLLTAGSAAVVGIAAGAWFIQVWGSGLRECRSQNPLGLNPLPLPMRALTSRAPRPKQARGRPARLPLRPDREDSRHVDHGHASANTTDHDGIACDEALTGTYGR